MPEKRFLQLRDLNAYKKAFELSNRIWDITMKWDYFSKDTIGKQFVKAADSIAANIAEGFGRFSRGEKIQFYRYSYGSIQEAIDWNNKALVRHLITKEQHALNEHTLLELPREVHHLITFTKDKLTI